MNKATPFKIDNKDPVRKFEVQENGDVKLIEKTEAEVWFKAREFITFIRQHEDGIKEIGRQLGAEHKKKLEEELVKAKKAFKEVQPLQKEVEEKAKADYEKTMKENMVKTLKSELGNKELRKDYVLAMWNNVKEEDKKDIMKQLTSDEQKKLIKLKAKR